MAAAARGRALTNAPTISVVVPARDAAHTLPALLEALAAQTLRADEIVVVDDASRDDTVAVAERYGAVVVRLEHNVGPGRARNAGVAATKSELIAFTDADCVPPPSWLARGVEFLREQRTHLATSGYLGPVHDDLSSWFQHWEKRSREPTAPVDICATNGHSLFVDRAFFLREGGMEDVRTSEDFLFGLKVAQHARVPFDPENGVFHHFRPELRSFFMQKLRFAQNSIRCNHAVPLKLNQLATFSPLRVLLDLALTACAAGLLLHALLAVIAGWSAWLAASAAVVLFAIRVTPFLSFLRARRGVAPSPFGRPTRPGVPRGLLLYSAPQLIVRDFAFMLGLSSGYLLLLFGRPVRLNPRQGA